MNLQQHTQDVKTLLDFYEPDREEVIAVKIKTESTVLVRIKPGQTLAGVIAKNLPDIQENEKAEHDFECLDSIPKEFDPENSNVYEV